MLTSDDITKLNEARKILKRLEDRTRDAFYDLGDTNKYSGEVDGHDLGRLSEAADVAEGAIFNVLNTARSYCKVAISDGEMHMREEVEV